MQNVDEVARLIHKHRDQDHDRIRDTLAGMRAPDVAEALNADPSIGEVAEVLGLIPLDKAIEVVGEPGLARRSAILQQVPPELGARLLDGLASDERTAIIRGMSKHCNRRMLDGCIPVSARGGGR
jgi:Mg/Co/Ni transporter MgtE